MTPLVIQCKDIICNSYGVVHEVLLTLEFESNLRQAQIYISRLRSAKEQKIMILGSKATLIFDDTKSWNEKLVMYQGMLDINFDSRIKQGHLPYQSFQVPQVEPLKRECSHFLECCKKRSLPKTDAQEALKITQILQAAQASIQEKIGKKREKR